MRETKAGPAGSPGRAGGRRGARACGCRVRRGFGGGAGGVAAAELVHQLPLATTPQEQQYEGVAVQEPGDLVAEGRGVFTGVAPVGAAALGVEVPWAGQQRDTGGCRVVGEPGGHLAVQQCGDVGGPLGDHVQQPVHCWSVSCSTWTLERYGVRRLPCTGAAAEPGATVTGPTAPPRA